MSLGASTDGSFEGFADFFDGVSARARRVGLSFEPELAPEWLRLTLADGDVLDWPLAELRARPGQADRATLVLSPGHDRLARLVVPGGPARRRIAGLAPGLSVPAPARGRARLAAWGAAALASVALIIFVLVPVMARQLANFLPPEGEQALGNETFEQIRVALGQNEFAPIRLCESRPGVAAIERMVARLNPAPDLPYPLRVHVLDHDLVNAFALPGGRVVFFRGLIEAAETPEEVAAVLSHEIGHVVYRHPTEGALRTAGSLGVLGLIFGDFAGGTVVLFLANQLIHASYSQQAESEADEFAHRLMADAGLPPAALGTFFRRLMQEYGDADGFTAHFSSHPKLIERIANATAAGAGVTLGDPVLSADDWRALRGICDADAPGGEMLENVLEHRIEQGQGTATGPDDLTQRDGEPDREDLLRPSSDPDDPFRE